MHHGAAGNAYCAGPGTLVEAMGEGRAAGNQAVKVRRVDFFIIQRVDGPKALVVRDNNQKIRFGTRGGRPGSR